MKIAFWLFLRPLSPLSEWTSWRATQFKALLAPLHRLPPRWALALGSSGKRARPPPASGRCPCDIHGTLLTHFLPTLMTCALPSLCLLPGELYTRIGLISQIILLLEIRQTDNRCPSKVKFVPYLMSPPKGHLTLWGKCHFAGLIIYY